MTFEAHLKPGSLQPFYQNAFLKSLLGKSLILTQSAHYFCTCPPHLSIQLNAKNKQDIDSLIKLARINCAGTGRSPGQNECQREVR